MRRLLLSAATAVQVIGGLCLIPLLGGIFNAVSGIVFFPFAWWSGPGRDPLYQQALLWITVGTLALGLIMLGLKRLADCFGDLAAHC